MDDGSQTHTSGKGAENRSDAAAKESRRSCLSYEEVRAQTGLSLSTLRRRVQEGTVPFMQPGGPRTRVFFPPDIVERLLQQAQREPAPSPAALPFQAATDATAHRGPKPKWMRNP